MPRIWCSECGAFLVGELVPGINLLEQGHVLSPPCEVCEGCERQLAQIEAEEEDVEYYARLLERDPKERARHREFCRAMNMPIFGDNGPKPKEEGE